MRRKHLFVIIASLAAIVALYFVAWPVPIAPVAWEAPPDPGYTGAFARNERLADFTSVDIGAHHGPEAMTVDRDGRIYAATEGGMIVRLAADGTAPEDWVDTGGRPLGMAFDSSGTLFVADAQRGLLAISPAGAIRVVATEADGVAFGFTDDLDVAADGRVYFSDATSKFTSAEWGGLDASILEMLEHAGNGRLLEYDPATDRVTTLLDGLVFANGVAMSHDQRSVLVNETGSYRVLRVTRDGDERGRAVPLIDALPGFPDNITRGLDGRYWVALVSPRNGLMDALSGRPFLRKMVQRLPGWLHPAPVNYGHVIAIDDSGRVVADLQDPAGGFRMITSALEVGGFLYLGSLSEPRAARIPYAGGP